MNSRLPVDGSTGAHRWLSSQQPRSGHDVQSPAHHSFKYATCATRQFAVTDDHLVRNPGTTSAWPVEMPSLVEVEEVGHELERQVGQVRQNRPLPGKASRIRGW